MVYNFSNEGIGGSIRKVNGSKIKAPRVQIEAETKLAKILVSIIKLLLLIYDAISLPVYYVIQRPDKCAREAQRTRSERVDINTWIKTDPTPNETTYLLHGSESQNTQALKSHCKLSHKYMGSTLCEMFCKAVQEFSTRPCLGYRAVVTCPIMTLDEEGRSVMQDKSFRSDYTWYTYEQIGQRVQDLASGLYFHSIYPGSRALFLANTCLEWFIASQACFQLNAQLVVAPEILDASCISLILREAEVNIIFVSLDRLQLLTQIFSFIPSEDAKKLQLKMIVIIDFLFSVDYNEPLFAQLRDASQDLSVEVLSFGSVEETGVENSLELSLTKYLNPENFNTDQLGSCDSQIKRTDPCKVVSISKVVDDCSFKETRIPTSAPLRRRSFKQLKSHKQPEVPSRNEDEKSPPHLTEDYSHRASSNNYLNNLHYIVSKISINDNSTKDTAAQLNDLAMIVYTHGSLGQLKAIMLTHSYLARCNQYLFLDGLVTGKDVHCSTLALDNVIEFMTEMCVFSLGGSIGYSCGYNTLFYDGKELFKRDQSDLEALNPTFLLLRPYILESLRSSIQNHINLKLSPLKSFLLTYVLYDYKKYWARRHFNTPLVDKIFCSELKKLFGSGVKYILCNGPTDCTETKDFFAFMVNIPVIELYSPDEAIVSLISVNDIWDYKRRIRRDSRALSWAEEEDVDDYFQDIKLMPPTVNRNTFKEDCSKNLLITSSILCPSLGTRIRLEDWDDFRTSDQPYPRGRVVIGGELVSKGYFKRQEATNKSYYMDSNFITWFRTDDIARVFPNGSFEIISSTSDMIKMDDGQFISLSQIEHILRNSQFVDNVCAICADDRKFVIALIVPNLRRLALKSPGEANLKMAIGLEPEPDELLDVEFRREVCNDRLLSEFVCEHLNELMAKAGFKSMSSRFYMVPEIWTPETELVTPSYVPKRNAIQKFYASDIQSIFKLRVTTNRLSARKNKIRKFSNPLN